LWIEVIFAPMEQPGTKVGQFIEKQGIFGRGQPSGCSPPTSFLHPLTAKTGFLNPHVVGAAQVPAAERPPFGGPFGSIAQAGG
jgi:hypothetical protein